MLIGPTWWWKLVKERKQRHKWKRYWKKNDRTKEQTNERASERIEQKSMNEILSKTREIEENPFPAIFEKYWKLLITIFYVKKTRNIKKKSNENVQKRRFPAYFRDFRPEKNFSQKSDSAMFWAFLIRIFVQKIRKN